MRQEQKWPSLCDYWLVQPVGENDRNQNSHIDIEPPLIKNTALMLHTVVWEHFKEKQILGFDNEAEVPVSNILVKCAELIPTYWSIIYAYYARP